MKQIKHFIFHRATLTVIFTAVLLSVSFFVAAQPVAAQVDVFDACATGGTQAVCQNRNNNLLTGDDPLWARIINVVTIIVGAVATLMIVVGGLRYALSGGDSSSTKSAKDTILYAAVGLVVAISANAVLSFVVNNI